MHLLPHLALLLTTIFLIPTQPVFPGIPPDPDLTQTALRCVAQQQGKAYQTAAHICAGLEKTNRAYQVQWHRSRPLLWYPTALRGLLFNMHDANKKWTMQRQRMDGLLSVNHLISQTVKGVPGVKAPPGVRVGPPRLHRPLSKDVRRRRHRVLERTRDARTRRQRAKKEWFWERLRKKQATTGWRYRDEKL